MQGKVYLVGAGPGDPDLMTVKGLKCIEISDVILYDRLVNKELLNAAKKDAELIYCGKKPKHHTIKQASIHYLLLKHSKEGKTVTRLKGGDPFVFGRGGEEAEVLAKHQVDFEIVPGITSGISAAAYAGIPVTHRGTSTSFAFVTGHCYPGKEPDIQWESLAKGIDTIAVYMGVSNFPVIKSQLIRYGKPEETPVALIQWGTTTEQKTVTGTLQNIDQLAKSNQIQNPTILIIGEVVRFREKINWFERIYQNEPMEAFV